MTGRGWLCAVVLALGCGDDAKSGTPDPEMEPGVDAGMTGDDDASAEEDASEPLTCDKGGALSPGDVTMTLTHAGVERRFLLHVPTSYTGDAAVPLVLDMHGLNGTPEYQKANSGWLRKSDEHGFLVAYPQGLDNSWHAGALCCGPSLANMVDDEGFLRALVAKLQSEACVNPKRIYATGLSNGGAMSHLLACRASDLFAAVAPISMSNSTMPCEPTRGISVTLFRATADELVAYDTPGSLYISAPADFEAWRQRNACQGEAESPNALCKTYTQCKDGSDVTLCTIPTTKEADAPWGGHLLYTQAVREGVTVADFVWAAFERHQLGSGK